MGRRILLVFVTLLLFAATLRVGSRALSRGETGTLAIHDSSGVAYTMGIRFGNLTESGIRVFYVDEDLLHRVCRPIGLPWGTVTVRESESKLVSATFLREAGEWGDPPRRPQCRNKPSSGPCAPSP